MTKFEAIEPSDATVTLHLPVDIVGHCQEHQCSANASEDHHSALVQHAGCCCGSIFLPIQRNERKREDLCAAEERHGLTGLSGMIIPTDYDDDDSKSRQNCLISTRGLKTFPIASNWTDKAEETSRKAPCCFQLNGGRERRAPFCSQSCTHLPKAVIYTYSHPLILWSRLGLISGTWAPWICHSSLPRKRSGLLLSRVDFTGRHASHGREVGSHDSRMCTAPQWWAAVGQEFSFAP